ncbi:MAG TPA: DUF6541 family protein [Patescibacteria group bacterium]|nr:DUF6541 family protein [Patescibacteria group bacterium]
MKWFKGEILSFLGIAFASIVICFDLFTHAGIPATMDGIIHITVIEQFYRVLQSGEFPVTWLDKFANYGQPVPLYAQQLPAYIGALLTSLTQNPVITFNLLIFLAIFLSASFFYVFLRFYFNPLISFVAVIIFSLAPYRIIDVYIRGDLPELLSQVLLPLILIGLYLLIQKKQPKGFYLILISAALLALCHPMMLLIYSFFIIPYVVFLILSLKEEKSVKVKVTSLTILAFIVGIGIASYYLIPLKIETKYLYFGRGNPFDSNLFFSWSNIFLERWQSHIDNGILTRVQIVQVGLPEILIVIFGLLLVIKQIFWDKKRKLSLLIFCVFCALLTLFFMLPYSLSIYEHTLLQNIQFPWRMLAIFIFIPPILLAIFLKNIKNKVIYLPIILFVVIIFLVIRVPQLYGKDYIDHPQGTYDFTAVNLNSVMMNTIWTGKTESYPVEKTKASIIGGKGEIISSVVRNSSRTYSLVAQTPLQMVDYTFYFPGWDVKVDNRDVPIQYQDPHYRGVITYNVPAGNHTVVLAYKPTKVRILANMLTFLFLGISIVLILLRKKLRKVIA